MVSYYAYPGLKFSMMDAKRMHSIRRGIKGQDPIKILEAVCEFYHQSYDKVKSKSRKRELVWCRQVFCRFCRTHTSMTKVQIGEFLGGRDHTTVIHSEQTAQDILDTDPTKIKELREIEYMFLFQPTVGVK